MEKIRALKTNVSGLAEEKKKNFSLSSENRA